jgi:hypothetical protein
LSGGADHVDPAAFAIELHHPVDQRKKRVVRALPDAAARVKPRADLTDQNVSGPDFLAAKFLTPRRWPFESRPFRLEPCPFLCAMS